MDALTVRDDGGGITNDLLRADLDEPALALAAGGFAALWRGSPPESGQLLPGRRELVAEVLTELVQSGRAEVDSAGALIGVHGLTQRATRHHFEHAYCVDHTWCAFDSVGIDPGGPVARRHRPHGLPDLRPALERRDPRRRREQ